MRRALLVVLLLIFGVGAGKRPAGLGDVTEIRVHEHGDHTRVVVELFAMLLPSSSKTISALLLLPLAPQIRGFSHRLN